MNEELKTHLIGYMIKKTSKKRSAELRRYERIKAELKKELIEKEEWFCFFSGNPLPEDAPFHPHHLRGRDGDLLCDKDNLVPCIWGYHRMWHDVPISKLKKLWWFPDFMERLKKKAPDVYETTINRL